MTSEHAQNLKDKIAALAAELSRLEHKRDDIIQQRRVREAGTVFGEISAAQRRLDAAKRLLARAEGDEYDFVTR